MLDEGVPGSVGVFEGWLAGEVVACFDGMSSTATKVINLVTDVPALSLELAVSLFGLLVAVIIFARVV